MTQRGFLSNSIHLNSASGIDLRNATDRLLVMLGFTLALATLLPVALSGFHCDDAYFSGIAGETRANGLSIIDLISKHTYLWMVLQARPFPVGLAAGLSATYFGDFDPLWPKLAHIFL